MEFDKYDICVSEKHFEEICESFPRNVSEFHRISVLASDCALIGSNECLNFQNLHDKMDRKFIDYDNIIVLMLV